MINNLGISQTLKINQKCKELSKNKKVFNCGFGQSPFDPPDILKRQICNNIDSCGYSNVQGILELRQSIKKHYSKYHNVSIAEDNILIGPGSKELLCLLNLCLKNHIYIIAPYWVSYYNQVKIFNIDHSIIHTKFEDKWKITCDQVNSLLDNSFLILNSPNNPTGQIYSRDELKQITDICREKNITIIADEIYQYLAFDETQTHTLLEIYPEQTIITNGLSKWCHCGGYRLGYMIFPEKLGKLKSDVICCASETFSCVNTPLQLGTIKLFENFGDIIDINKENIKVLKKISSYLYYEFINLNIKVHKSEGAFYFFLDFTNYESILKKNNIHNSVKLVENLLDETGIAILPGSAFGIIGLTARYAFTNVDMIENKIIISKITEWIKKLQSG
tara:strand:+ start:84 stop:1253 length:1170 start_codon:yes stop_codon:yes gene_type:complete